MAHDIFISYASGDRPAADAICAALEQRGFRCWIAPRNVLPGQDYGEAIVEAIASARALVVVLSARANASDQVKNEVERAVNVKIPVAPLRIEDVLPTGSLALHLARRHWLDALTPPLGTHLAALAEGLQELLGPSEVAPTTPEDQVASPALPELSVTPPPPPDAGTSGEADDEALAPGWFRVTLRDGTAVTLPAASLPPGVTIHQDGVGIKLPFARIREARFLTAQEARGLEFTSTHLPYAIVTTTYGRVVQGCTNAHGFHLRDADDNSLFISTDNIVSLALPTPRPEEGPLPARAEARYRLTLADGRVYELDRVYFESLSVMHGLVRVNVANDEIQEVWFLSAEEAEGRQYAKPDGSYAIVAKTNGQSIEGVLGGGAPSCHFYDLEGQEFYLLVHHLKHLVALGAGRAV